MFDINNDGVIDTS